MNGAYFVIRYDVLCEDMKPNTYQFVVMFTSFASCLFGLWGDEALVWCGLHGTILLVFWCVHTGNIPCFDLKTTVLIQACYACLCDFF